MELAQVVLGLGEREPAVQVDLLRLGLDVGGRDERVHLRLDAHRARDRPPRARELRDRLAEELEVELEPDRRDVARLLRAEEVAGAADLEVAHRDREPRAELGVVGERGEPGPRLGRQLLPVRVEEVGVRGHVASADAPADLVELREPERVGPLHDQGVRLRDVEARLDDRRRDEDVRVAREEGQHVILELALRELPVRDEEAKLGAELLERARPLLDRLDPVVQEEGLAAALVLAHERLAHEVVVVLAHVRPDRAAPLRRRLDHADVAQARRGTCAACAGSASR